MTDPEHTTRHCHLAGDTDDHGCTQSGDRYSRLAPGLAMLLGLALVSLACGDRATDDPPAGQPKIVLPDDAPLRVILVTVDTLRADRLGFAGYARDTSPFLDRLASEGTVFTRAYASISHTSPSHATIFTGLEPAQHGLLQNGETLHPELSTLAEVFRDAGYRTAAFSTVGFVTGLSQGFETFSTWRKYRPADEVLAGAKQWISSQGPGARLFVWIHLFDVHQWDRDDHLDREGLGRIESDALQGEALAAYLAEEQGIRAGGFRSEVLVEATNRYDAQIWSLDRALARFWDALGAGFHDGTLWVLTSDHGEGLGNHDFLGHGLYVYEEQLRVPLIFVGEGVRPGQTIEQAVGLVDLAPTLAQAIGASMEGQRFPVAGRSLYPLLVGAELEPNAIWAQRRPADASRIEQGWDENDVFSLLEGEHKVIARTDGSHELYDLADDPFELHDLAETSDPLLDRRRRELLRRAVQRYREMSRQGAEVQGDGIDPGHLEELEALGYL